MPRPTVRALMLLALLGAVPPAAGAGEQAPEWLARSRDLAGRLATELRSELQRAIASDGPVAAIDVCRKRAPEIAAAISQESGALVGRTALEVRNPANAPDELQRAILEQFAGELASGRYELPLEAAVEIGRAGQVERRYLRAIPMEDLCTACHGKDLAPEIASAIAKAYPDDRATGFETGQLRGAVTVTWPPGSVEPVSSPPR